MAEQNDGGQIPGGQQAQPGAENIQPAGQQNAPGGGQQPVAGQQNGGAQEFRYKEDRSDWVPRSALNENNPKFRQRLTAAEQRAQTLEAELTAERNRVRALAGLGPQATQEQQQSEEVKNLILQMFPELKELPTLKEQNQQAREAADRVAVEHWERHSVSMLNELESSVAKAIGVDKLSPKQVRQLRQAYTAEAQQSVNDRFVNIGGQWVAKDGDFSNDFMSRHDRGDKTLIAEFAKEFVNEWFEPARRQVTSQVARRGARPVPNGARSGQVTTKTPEIDYNNPDAFKKALLEARRGGNE